jgi:hypothetical protein
MPRLVDRRAETSSKGFQARVPAGEAIAYKVVDYYYAIVYEYVPETDETDRALMEANMDFIERTGFDLGITR